MKYPYMAALEDKVLNIKKIDGGLNASANPDKISNNQLSACNNVWNKNGKVCTRPGLTVNAQSVIRRCSESVDEDCTVSVSENTFNINGKNCKIVSVGACYDEAFFDNHIYFLGDDDSITNAGTMQFNRVSSEEFYLPSGIVYYSGAPVNGGGIFALITLFNSEGGTQKYYNVYEINSNLDGWNRITNFYVPTIYINGRGTRFNELNADQVYTDSPMSLESPNMLTGCFKAYFTSDGYSSCFRLPVNNLAEDTIKCRVYHSQNDYYEWVITGNVSSDTKQFFNTQVTLTVDREKGIMNFTSGNENYSLPIMYLYRRNNICVMAYRNGEEDFNRVASATAVAYGDSCVFVAGGKGGNEIFSAKFTNPLYFEKSASVIVGDISFPVTALKAYKNKVIAFKQNEVYSISFTAGAAFSENSLLADNQTIFYKPDTLKSECIKSNVGCSLPKTVQICGNNLVWMGADRHIYMLSSASSGSMYNLSSQIDSMLAAENEYFINCAFAFVHDNYYVLLINGKSYIMNFAVKGFSYNGTAWENGSTDSEKQWYIWNFRSGIQYCGAFSNRNRTYIICLSGDGSFCYRAILDNSAVGDTDITVQSDEPVANSTAISSYFTTKQFDFDNSIFSKNINGIYLSAECDGDIEIEYMTPDAHNKTVIKGDNGTVNSIRLRPMLHGVQGFGLKVSSDERIAVSELAISYNILQH